MRDTRPYALGRVAYDGLVNYLHGSVSLLELRAPCRAGESARWRPRLQARSAEGVRQFLRAVRRNDRLSAARIARSHGSTTFVGR